MHALESSYNLLSFIGFWMPPKWQKRKYLKFFYKFYSSIIAATSFVMVSLQITLLFTNEIDFQFFVDILFTFLLSLSFELRGATLLFRREKIIRLSDMLKKNFCLPRDEVEQRMQKQTDSIVRKVFLVFNFNTHVTLFLFVIAPFFQDEENRKLPFQIWLPFSLQKSKYFWYALGLEYGILSCSTHLNATADILVNCSILQASNQFDFIKHRIRRLCEHKSNDRKYNEEVEILKEYVKHHNYILEFLEAATKTFNFMLMQAYLNSVFILSVIVYQFTFGSSSVMHKLKSAGYLVCMLLEILVFCWFGNQLTDKSSKFGYNDCNTNWLVLNERAKKMLHFMALRTTHPAVISYGGVINFNLASFKKIMKVTYSAFNLMKKFN